MSKWIEIAPGGWARLLDGRFNLLVGKVRDREKFYASCGYMISDQYKSLESAKRGAERWVERKCKRALADLRGGAS